MNKLTKLFTLIGSGLLGISLASCGKKADQAPVEEPIEVVEVADGDLMNSIGILKYYTESFVHTNTKDRMAFDKSKKSAEVLGKAKYANKEINQIEYNSYIYTVDAYGALWVKLNIEDALKNAFDKDAITITSGSGDKTTVTALSSKLNNMYAISGGEIQKFVDSAYTYDKTTGFSETPVTSNVSSSILDNYIEMIDTLFDNEKLNITYNQSSISSTYVVEGLDENHNPYSARYQIANDELSFMSTSGFVDDGLVAETFSFSGLDLEKYIKNFRSASDDVYSIKYAPAEEMGKE